MRYRRKSGRGRKVFATRHLFESTIYVLCAANGAHAVEVGYASCLHRYFLEWETAGFFGVLANLGWSSTTA